MEQEFEWDDERAASNRRKHGGFREALTVFGDPLAITVVDATHAGDETRLVITGNSNRGRLQVVVHVDRGAAVRIIGARRATPAERLRREQGQDEKT